MATDTRARMLETTARLLQHRGYHGTPLSDILRESGAPRGSLYFHFPGGKEQLAIEATRAGIEETTSMLREILAAADDPARGARAFVEAAAGIMGESGYTFGCPVAPVILDAHANIPELADLCRRAFEEWTGVLTGAFTQAGILPERASALALLVCASLEGGMLVSRAYRETEPMQTLAIEIESAIRSAMPQHKTRRTLPAHR